MQKEKKMGKLQPKLIRAVLLAVLVAFLIIFSAITYYFYHNNKEQELKNDVNQVNQAASQINFLQTTTNNIARQVIVDATVRKGLATEKDSSGTYLYNKRQTREALLSYAHIVDSISEILILSANGDSFTSMTSARAAFVQENNAWYTKFKETGKSSGFTQVHTSAPYQDNYSQNVISYVMSFYVSDGSRGTLGDIIISLAFSDIEEIMNMDTPLMNACALYDGNGNIIYKTANMSVDYKEIMEKEKDGQMQCKNGNICLIAKGMQDDWVLVTEISGELLRRQAVMAMAYMAMAFIGLGVVLFLMLSFLIRRIVNPVKSLTDAAVAVGNGDFSANVNIHTNDELEVLADVFNHMVRDIQQLMLESVDHEKTKRKMQVDKLMNQINPHFIYNTLNSIVYMARMNGNREIADFTNAFISLLQGTLRVQDSVYITLREELTNIRNYLVLQEYRYVDKFQVEINCDEAYMDCLIPCIMLEPIVENSIFHGIAPKEGAGILQISIKRIDADLEICVKDDGIGMSQETIHKLMTDEAPQRGAVHKIGVANVRKRIRQIYGEDYDLHIESKENVGTKITLRLIYRTEEE